MILIPSILLIAASATQFAAAIPTSGLIPRVESVDLEKCPGYAVTSVRKSGVALYLKLDLAGEACNVYGTDLETLILEVNYDSENRLHVKIADPGETRYQVPESVFPRLNEPKIESSKSDLVFQYIDFPFSFTVSRKSTGEKLFDTTGNALIFESQYLRLKTNLPTDANIYGLGEHTENFRLPTVNLTRTLWSRDAYGIPRGTNLYGNHPIYFEHRETGTHGVFLLSSNGMDIKIDTVNGETSLEYNVIGGILDLYFFSGPDPEDVAKQYAEVVGTPAMMPYWGFGLHQCRYGYRDWIDVAEVIANYSAAGIPLETMWTDIDYMYQRWVFTLDPERFPLEKMRQIVDVLHSRDQHYIVMVDPAVAYEDYPTFNRGVDDGVLLKQANDSSKIFKGVVWPGVAAFLDWFHPNISSFWIGEFERFFNPETGIDIDGVWIDMNDPSNFCTYPCTDPEASAKEQGLPPARLPVREPPRRIEGFPETYNITQSKAKRDTEVTRSVFEVQNVKRADVEINYIYPPYAIANAAPEGLSDRTVFTDVVHANGLLEYDTHNLYGTMMSMQTHDAMISRRPSLRPLVITRSTFAGAGHKVGKWLGDNLSEWEEYRWQIAGMLNFASIFQLPMVGSDVCGFGGNTTEQMCARWAMLGAFNPFYRDHNDDTSIPQEFYRWETVAEAAKKAINMRYRLLDYIYTKLYKASQTGSPLLYPMFYKYPQDANTFALEHQFFYGDSILVAPVTEENATSVNVYLPNDVFYDFEMLKPVYGQGKKLMIEDVGLTDIPVFIKGGSIIPLRAESAMTTAELRTQPFVIVVAPGVDGEASGELYLDDGESLVQGSSSYVKFVYGKGRLCASGRFGWRGDSVVKVVVAGEKSKEVTVEWDLEGEWEVTV